MCAVPSMTVFCSSLTSWFPGMLLTYFLNEFEMFPVAPIITEITFVFTFYMRCISIVRSLYFRIFSASFLITFLSPEIASSINIHVLFSLSRIIMFGLLLGMVLSVWTCWFHSMVTLPPWPVSTDFGTCAYQCFLANCTPVSLHMLKCSCAQTLSCLFMYHYYYYYYFIIIIIIIGGTRWRSWLRHCATSRKVAGSIPNYVTGFFHWHKPSGRTMALGSTQPLTEKSTRNVSWR